MISKLVVSINQAMLEERQNLCHGRKRRKRAEDKNESSSYIHYRNKMISEY
jgi:hypothetical protein